MEIANQSVASIAILCTSNVRHMSPIVAYTDVLDSCGVKYDLIYMDKYGEDEEFDCNKKYRFINRINSSLPSVLKSLKYLFFLPYGSFILLKNKYRFVIVWNDLTALLFAGFLRRHFSGAYCINVRDEMGYRKPLLYKRYSKVFSRAAFCTISSKKYEAFLPSGINYVPINSLNFDTLTGLIPRDTLRSPDKPLRIGFIGNVRFFEKNEELLRLFKNDKRYELHFYGTNANKLDNYAKRNGITNCVFHDTFPVKDTGRYLNNIDIVNNIYGNETEGLRLAVSIKLFHALYARLPILVCANTYTADLAKKAGIGFEVDPEKLDSSILEKIQDWYYALDCQNIARSCAAFLHSAEKENDVFRMLLMEKLNLHLSDSSN